MPRPRMNRTSEQRIHQTRASEVNPFLHEEMEGLPKIPSDPEYDYFWMRVKLDGNDDGANIVATMRSRLAPEPVKASDMPDLRPMAIAHGDYGDVIAYKDVILCKVRRDVRRQYLRAVDIRTEELAASLRQQVSNSVSDRRARLVEYTDDEQIENRRVLPIED